MKEDITYAIPSEDEEYDLVFICPQCGSDRLYAVQEEITGYTEIDSVDADGGICYGRQDFDDSDLEDDALYQCCSCGYELENEKGRPVIGEYELVEWLENNSSEQRESGSEE